MDTLNVMNTLKTILSDLGIPEESLHEDTLLCKHLQLDSVETVEIALGLKRKLGVKVKLEALQDMTLAQVCNMVEGAIAPLPAQEKTQLCTDSHPQSSQLLSLKGKLDGQYF